jgi:hypothetical protein
VPEEPNPPFQGEVRATVRESTPWWPPQENAAQNQERAGAIVNEIAQAVNGIDGKKYRWVPCKPGNAQDRDRHEPYCHDRPECASDARRALRLEGKERDQDNNCHGENVGLVTLGSGLAPVSASTVLSV